MAGSSLVREGQLTEQEAVSPEGHYLRGPSTSALLAPYWSVNGSCLVFDALGQASALL